MLISARRQADALESEKNAMKHLCEHLSETVASHQVSLEKLIPKTTVGAFCPHSANYYKINLVITDNARRQGINDPTVAPQSTCFGERAHLFPSGTSVLEYLVVVHSDSSVLVSSH